MSSVKGLKQTRERCKNKQNQLINKNKIRRILKYLIWAFLFFFGYFD